MKKLLALFSLLILSMSAQAIEIKGKVADNNKQPIEFATITLLKSDSSHVSGLQTNTEGLFHLKGEFSRQDYILRISFVGFRTSYILLRNLNASIDLGTIKLGEHSHSLDEITVTGNRIINKVDKQIIFPDQMQVKSSANAFDLLSNMSLSRLNVDPVNRSLKKGNENVQLRINGVRAEINEVVALRPQDILRVDYYEDPGARFGSEDVAAVIDVIVNREFKSGGYISMNARNSPFVGFGDDNISFKANYKASEFGLSYFISYRDYNKRWNDGIETFNFPGNPVSRELKGIEAPMAYQYHNLNASYNLTKPNKYIFNVILKDEIFNNNSYTNHTLSYLNSNKQTHAERKNKGLSNTPVLDIFYKRDLKNKQSVAVNLVGTYIRSENESFYTESEKMQPLTDIYNQVKGNKYSLIGEVVYNKEFNNKSFSSGVKHTQGYADNKYIGNNPYVSDMKNADSYIFAQLQGKISKKIGYSIGFGAARVWFQEGGNEATFHSLRPSLRLSYAANDQLNIKYNFRIMTSTPSLAMLSSVVQQADSFIINSGNPNLKPYNRYRNDLTLSYNKGILGANLNLAYTYSDNPFFRTYSISGDKITGRTENHKNMHSLNLSVDANLKLIKNIWTINGWVGINRSINNTNTSTLTYTGMYGGFSSNVLYKNYTLAVGFNSRYKELWGESIQYGEDWSYAEAGYTHKEARLALGMSYPLKSYWSAGGENMSPIAPSKSWTYIKENGRMLYLKFSWNMSFGRKHKAGEKNLNNADNDKGIL